MAGQARRLTFVLDQNLGAGIATILRLAHMEPVGRITTLTELGFAADAPDEEWMPRLGARGDHAVVTRDGEILRASVRLEAWRISGLTLMLLDGLWGQLPLRELTRSVLYWWPLMVHQAVAAPLGTAWTVPHRVPSPSKPIRQVMAVVPDRTQHG